MNAGEIRDDPGNDLLLGHFRGDNHDLGTFTGSQHVADFLHHDGGLADRGKAAHCPDVAREIAEVQFFVYAEAGRKPDSARPLVF